MKLPCCLRRRACRAFSRFRTMSSTSLDSTLDRASGTRIRFKPFVVNESHRLRHHAEHRRPMPTVATLSNEGRTSVESSNPSQAKDITVPRRLIYYMFRYLISLMISSCPLFRPTGGYPYFRIGAQLRRHGPFVPKLDRPLGDRQLLPGIVRRQLHVREGPGGQLGEGGGL